MIFVKESVDGKTAHFKHYLGGEAEKECEYYKKYDQSDIENEYTNDKSDFHKRWQTIFDDENLEKKIQENGKKHIADIYIKNDEGVKFSEKNNEIIYKNFIPNELIIEIQHSKMSYENLMERTEFYHNEEKKREIIWIFDLKQECEIFEIITTINNIYRIKLKNQNNHVFQHLLKIDEFKPIIFLDNNDENIYLIKNKTKLDKDFIDVLKISKNNFLGELSKNINKNFKWTYEINNNNYKKINYAEIINKEIFDKQNKEYLNYIFYLLESIPYYEIKTKLDDLYHFIRLYSFNNNKIRQLFINYVKSNRTIYRNIINFGKNSGKSINEVEYNYLKWIYEKYDLEYATDENGNIDKELINGSESFQIKQI
jgi:hypothetical protein